MLEPPCAPVSLEIEAIAWASIFEGSFIPSSMKSPKFAKTCRLSSASSPAWVRPTTSARLPCASLIAA